MLGNILEYQLMAECEKSHWWYKNLHRMTYNSIKRHFGDKQLNTISVLDLGCGTGGTINSLINKGIVDICGYDISKHAVEIARSNQLPVSQGDIRDISQLTKSNRYDVVICHDVFYFLNESEQKNIFTHLIGALSEKGLLLMNLPAYELFSGAHDIAVGINKRFNLNRIKVFIPLRYFSENKVKLYKWPFLLFPLIAVVRKLRRVPVASNNLNLVKSDLEMPTFFANWFLDKLMLVESVLGLRKVFGSSIFIEFKR